MGTLFYVIGASGAGKDTLMNYAREKINGSQPVIFAHRYITRPPFFGDENHIYLSENEFLSRLNAGLFALHWQSHEKYYGIGIEINKWMDQGYNVVANGSRQYLPVAQQRFPNMKVLLIEASPEIIAQRLSGRGRENAEEIQKRIARTAQISTDLDNCIKIKNDTAIEDAGNQLIDIICLRQKIYI